MEHGYSSNYAENSSESPNPSSLYETSDSQSMTGSASLIRKHPAMTNHRRSPESFVPLDAPTQPRRYLTPSSTSKKEVPAFFSKSRLIRQSHEEEEDELTEEPPADNATDQEKIEYKRRQNTLAARRSRMRRALYQQQLEEAVERLTAEKEAWRTRALAMRQILHSHGIPYPDFRD